MTIRITQCSNGLSWYRDRIGEVFETYGAAFEYAQKGNIVYFIKNVSGVKFVKIEDADEVLAS
jgi:hypothetical protein